MIESTNLKMLRNLEAFQVFSDILAFLHEEEPVEEPLKGLRDTFAARLSDYDTALVPERRSRYTAELARLDGQRDYVFRSLTAHLKLYLSSFDAVQVKAAEALLASLRASLASSSTAARSARPTSALMVLPAIVMLAPAT